MENENNNTDENKSASLSGAVETVRETFDKLMNPQMDMPMNMPMVEEVFPDYVIACVDDKYYKIKYKTDKAGAIVFEPQEQWVEVEETYKPVAKSVEGELVAFGAEVKALEQADGSVKLGGYLVKFGDESNPDLTGDFFAADTDFGDVKESDVYFNHRMPVEANGKRITYKNKLARTTLTKDDAGIFAEVILAARNDYEKAIIEAGLAGRLGWSSGTAQHLVEREQVGKAWKITAWPLGLDASLTPRPAEARLSNMVIPLKSLGVYSQDEAKRAGQEKSEAEQKPEIVIKSKGVNTMELEETKLQEMLAQAAEAGATKAISALEPVKSSGGTIQVVVDESERPFKTLAAQVQAVKDYTLSFGRVTHPRINFLKAVQGASEGVPTDGGILLDPTLSPEVMKPIHQEGVFSADVRKLPVSNNSNSGWINGVDETDRATGSRWGGLRGYRLAEGDTVTKSKPKFRRINWELKKYGVLVYDTNELLKDAAQFSAIVEQGCREEIAFMLNDDIMNGLGVSGPLGVMNSPALITTTRVTTATIVGADVSTMWQRLSLTSKAKAKWYVNSECAPQLDALFAVGSTAVLFPYAGYTPDGVRTLYGRPIVETEFNAALNTTGDIMLADMSEYLLWEKGNVEMASSMHVEFLTDQEVIRFIYRCDGQPAAASPVTPYKGTLTHGPFVVIGSASA